MSIIFRDRKTKALMKEQIYGETAIRFLYGNTWFHRFAGAALLTLICKNALFSKFYGWLQKRPQSRKKIASFIEKYQIDATEFKKNIEEFASFNDFFIRELKEKVRPITNHNSLIAPADGRYLAIPTISESDGFLVKGETFSLKQLLLDKELADRYYKGTMVMARLCPTDYHRFHFPCDCTPSETQLINGWLYSVNPIALKQNCQIFTKNKRSYTLLKTESFGTILFMEVGATSVGTIVQTFTPDKNYKQGDEKGYFSFGGSSIIMLFEPGKISLDADLAATASDKIELRCLFGQSIGR